jgi:hypothetical protein
MTTQYLYHGRYTHWLTRCRRTTRHRMTEVEAIAQLSEPARVDNSLLVIDPQPHGTGLSFASGLVTREDGPKMQVDPSPAGPM